MGYAAPAGMDDDDDRAIERANADLNEKDRIARQEAAVSLRIAGANYSEIMRTLEYASVTAARQAVERALAASVGEDDKKQARFIQRRRLERLLRSTWAQATTESVQIKDPVTGQTVDVPNEQHLPYVRTALALVDRIIRLDGLDAPTEAIIYNPSNREVEMWIQSMVERNRGDLPQEYDVIEGHAINDNPVGDDE